MDIETGLICAGVCVLSGVVVYFISIFGIRQRTFEEAVEEQLKKGKEDYELNVEKSPRKEKKYKKWGRKHKDKDEKGASIKNELLDVGHLDDQDRFIENFETLASCLNDRNSSLVNEDDSDSCGRHQEEAMELKQRRVYHDTPRTDADNCSFGEEESLNTEETWESKAKDMKTQTVASHFIMQTPLNECVKQQVENLGNGVVEEEVIMTAERLLHMLENMSLTDEESQMLMDVLASKQSGISEWTTVQKNDPVAMLKRQLADREKQLDIEQTRAEAANSKMQELKEELSREKSHFMTVEKSLQEKVNQLERENEALKFSIQQSCEQHQEETSLLQLEIEQMQSNLQGEQALIIKKLQEEKDHLKQALANLEAAKPYIFSTITPTESMIWLIS
ncbi:restin homolog [Limulus polyphemus]|uniref:Restin homolog n=1 Tax=Limulus polyphemus TaxID=6850 RepID=A0ABM1T0H1_LIMPO|nr:restin homolog [Limulus polyphemus]XP_022249375.1 restin homolog [Limulus polyphemus]XP_022249377.1 restin homolog [Limulus polyphemus]